MVRLPHSGTLAAMGDLDILKRYVATTFVISASGRIERGPSRRLGPRRDSAEEIGAGPRVFFAGCSAGNIVHVRHDADDRTASRIIAAAENEPPWSDIETPPRCLDEIVELLSGTTPVEIIGPEVFFTMPNDLTYQPSYEHSAIIAEADTAEGERLLDRLKREGMPPLLLEAGFMGLEDFWWPWCVALDGREILSIAFTPHISEVAAEIGVFTFPPFRGRGLAAAVSACWSSSQGLKGRTLTYCTPTRNRSSRNVAARLGLRCVGARILIG
jgi:hypothetical protein